MKIFLYLCVTFVPILIVNLIDSYFISKTFIDNPKIVTKNNIKIFFLINFITLMVMSVILKYNTIFILNSLDYLYFFYYFVIALFIGIISLFCKYLINKYFYFEKKKKNKKTTVIYIVSIVLFFIAMLFISCTWWEEVTYYNASFDQILITMLTPVTGSDPKLVCSFLQWPILHSVAFTYFYALIFYKNATVKFIPKNKIIFTELYKNITSLSLSIIMLISGFIYLYNGVGLDKMFMAYFNESSFIEDNYVDPGKVEIKVPTQKRNLIHIYLESIENTFFDKNNGGIMEENLMPNLLNLYSEGYNFSNLDNNYGGPLKTYGGSFSVASMTNQFFGLPMKVPCTYKQYCKEDSFLPGAVGIGDILASANYNQTFLLGGDSIFSGLDNLYTYHGNFKIMDYKYAIKNKLIPKDYGTNWGYEDRKLYEFAKTEINRLASLNEPFHVIVENVDSHNPGLAFKDGEPIFEENNLKPDYAKTISYSEKDVYNFVKWIQEQPFYENTTIVIIGDHNSMDPSLFKGLLKDNYIRTTYNLILNPISNVIINDNVFNNRLWANFDMMPTILASLGFEFEGNRLGLGTNLFSGAKTVYEQYGYENITNELYKKSKFYNKKFVRQKIKYDGSNLV